MYEAPIPMINYVLVSITAAVLAYVTAMDVENAENETDSSSAVNSLPSLNDSYNNPVEAYSPAPAPAPAPASPPPAPASPPASPPPAPASPPMAEAYIPPKSEVEGGKRRTAVKNKTTRNATIISNKKQNKKKTRNNKNRKLK